MPFHQNKLEVTYRKAKESLLQRYAKANDIEKGKIKRQLSLLELVFYKNYNLEQLAKRFGLPEEEVRKDIKDLLSQRKTLRR